MNHDFRQSWSSSIQGYSNIADKELFLYEQI